MSASADPGRAQRLLAVDVGGTKIAAALITPDGRIESRMQAPTSQGGPRAGIEQIAAMLRQLVAVQAGDFAAIQAIGVGIPAVLESETDHVIWAPNLPGWRDVPLRAALQAMLGVPVFVEYDGHTAVLGEWWVGAARGCSSCVDVIVGTGIGGGMILDGRLFRGHDRLAGAAGWFSFTPQVTFDPAAERKSGDWELLAAGPGIVARAQAALGDHPRSTLAEVGEQMTARDVFNAARSGDVMARQVIEQTADYLGVGLANIVSLVNPQIIILGGSIGAQGDLLLPRIREVVQETAQPLSAQSVRITSSTLGTDAGLYGAALAAQRRSTNHVLTGDKLGA